MNEGHVLCDGPRWRDHVRGHIIPWAVAGLDLGPDVVEVGPGYGATTDVFREQVGRLTSVEVDPALATRLAARLEGSNVTVVQGDGTALPFPDRRFSAGLCFSMLHHVPAPALQDAVLAEARRVLVPGAPFVAADGRHSDALAAFHEGDTYLPLDPATVAGRLEAQGFVAVVVEVDDHGWVARARTPA